MLRNFPVYFQWLSLATGDSTRHTRDMVDEKTLEEMRANFDVDRGRADPKFKRRNTQTEVEHDVVRRFVAAYIREADPDTPGTDMSDKERDDLRKGIREKWAVIRAAEYYQCDDRTIREIVHPSRRTRRRS
jgi:hypothetical protein